jgi:hypothetical protein
MNVAFCFIVKDGNEYISRNLQKIVDFADRFTDNYRIFYTENDSTDNTIKILNKFKKKYSRIRGIHLKLDGKHSSDLCDGINLNCNRRTRRLAFLRNNVLEIAKKWKKCNFMFMLDLDFEDFDPEKLNSMFEIIKKDNKMDAIFGMSRSSYNIAYDIGAIEPIYKRMEIFYSMLINSSKLIVVDSAFSGFGIYRMKNIRDKNLRYNEKTNTIEHIDFNKKLKNKYVFPIFDPVYSFPNSVILAFIVLSILLLIILIYFIYYFVNSN